MNTLITAMNQTFPPLKQWVIPSYQRNYVWTEEGQWTPLWKLVVADIQLSQGQNSHAIFEALNARGEPLTEWEKTKNYILSLAVAKDDPDGDLTYREHLERYDAEWYWRGHTDMFLLYFAWLEVPRARQLVSGREPPKAERLRMNRLYREFRYVGEHLYRDARSEFEMMLRQLRRYADIYREIDEGSEATNGGFSGYALKVMGRRHILNLRSLVPVLMILVDRLGRGPELDRVLRIVDSYLMRRIALKGRYRDFDSVAFSLVQALRDTDEEDLASVVLSRLLAIRG